MLYSGILHIPLTFLVSVLDEVVGADVAVVVDEVEVEMLNKFRLSSLRSLKLIFLTKCFYFFNFNCHRKRFSEGFSNGFNILDMETERFDEFHFLEKNKNHETSLAENTTIAQL